MEISFFERMRIPTVTHNDLEPRRGRGGRYYIGKTDRLLEAEETWRAHFASHTPKRPLSGALRVELDFAFLDQTIRDEEPKITKPDLDNMAKTILDVMASLGWFASGDQQIASLKLVKENNPRIEGIMVRVSEIQP